MYLELKVLIFGKIVIAISKNTLTKKLSPYETVRLADKCVGIIEYLINILSLIDIKYMYERDE